MLYINMFINYLNSFKFKKVKSSESFNYKIYSRLFKILNKINKKSPLFYYFWVINCVKSLKFKSISHLIFLLINTYRLNILFFFKSKKSKKSKKFKFVNRLKKKIKSFFTNNNFIKLQKIFWPVRSTTGEYSWTKSNVPLKKSIKGFFLRKTKSFYKGRYARNRQTCRVIVFWTLAFNLIWIYSLYFFFYQFSFNFGYVWWGLFSLYFSLIWSSFIKHALYNPKNILLEFVYFFKWLFLFFKSMFFLK